MKHSQQNIKTMTSNFEKWLNHWDLTIQSYDSQEEYLIKSNQCSTAISIIDEFLHQTDNKAMHGKSKEQAAIALIKNQEKKSYVNLTKARNIITAIMFDIEKMQELNHRKTNEIFN